MSLKASCLAVKQQFYGHFLATKIFHLATEKKISVATWRSHKKVNFGPCKYFQNVRTSLSVDILGKIQTVMVLST